MVVSGSWCFFSGIDSTQVGHPLSDCSQGFRHRIRSDRVTGGSQAASISQPEHEEVAQLVFFTFDKIEGRAVSQGVAELDPLGVDGVFGGFGAHCVGGAGRLESKAEISFEASPGGS